MENRQDRVRDVFLAAAELPPEQRAAYLDQTCGSDAELRSAIQRLIDADGSTGSFIAPEVAIPRFAAGTIRRSGFAWCGTSRRGAWAMCTKSKTSL